VPEQHREWRYGGTNYAVSTSSANFLRAKNMRVFTVASLMPIIFGNLFDGFAMIVNYVDDLAVLQ
jgi:hypothetical protein